MEIFYKIVTIETIESMISANPYKSTIILGKTVNSIL